ncbi:hypothetical protein P154DRAFT_532365 [Amniculicola lignicola CBS 123094]|uniref:Uncharacterized protein n=1 Tax=Amniculicola lignicola CBS 123094 TaxID=1392246 RepID=A0A6A5WNZ0_9PLEO|nr:hypothetical protein P154DRAFT_532365 [Amniculicola lignicola CBS 123094]
MSTSEEDIICISHLKELIICTHNKDGLFLEPWICSSPPLQCLGYCSVVYALASARDSPHRNPTSSSTTLKSTSTPDLLDSLRQARVRKEVDMYLLPHEVTQIAQFKDLIISNVRAIYGPEFEDLKDSHNFDVILVKDKTNWVAEAIVYTKPGFLKWRCLEVGRAKQACSAMQKLWEKIMEEVPLDVSGEFSSCLSVNGRCLGMGGCGLTVRQGMVKGAEYSMEE